MHLYIHSPCFANFFLKLLFQLLMLVCLGFLQKKNHLKVEIQDVQVSNFLHFLLLSYVTIFMNTSFKAWLFFWDILNESDGNILKSLPFILSIQLSIRLGSSNFKTFLSLDKPRLSFLKFPLRNYFQLGLWVCVF